MSTDDDSNTTTISNTQTPQVDAVKEGKLILPPNTSARRVTKPKKPKKEYPPVPPGKRLIFRKINGRTVPMHVDL